MILNYPYDTCRRYISPFIEQQFPELYQQDGRELIELLTAYYEFEEETRYQFLNESSCLTVKDDIDTTLDEFVRFFKSKFMKDMPFENATQNRFLIKHIFDLYTSKGTERSLKLLFQIMFGEEDVNVYYPDKDVLRPSHSIWLQPRYIELPHSESNYLLSGNLITGSESKSTAFVDKIITNNVNGYLVDVLYLTDQRGEFIPGDYLMKDDNKFGSPVMSGSMTSLNIVDGGDGFNIGDVLTVSSSTGTGGSVRVTSTQNADNKVYFSLLDGGSGYTPTVYSDGTKVINSPTKIYVSDLVLSIPNSSLVDGDKLYDATGTLIGTVMESDSSTVWLYGTTGPSNWSSLLNTSVYLDTTQTVSAGTVDRVYQGSGATFEIFPLKDVFTSTLNTDIIGDLNNLGAPYPSVLIDAPDYEFPKTVVPDETIATIIQDALSYITLDMGTVTELVRVNQGSNYDVSIKIKVVNELIAGSNYLDQVITFPETTLLSPGTIITQSNGATAKIISRSGGSAVIRPLVFGSYFQINQSVTDALTSKMFVINSIRADETSKPMGSNIVIDVETKSSVGKITGLEVLTSGIGFSNGETVTLTSASGRTLTAIAHLEGTGISRGEWVTHSSHISWKSTRIHDNYYYQEHSYEVTSSRSMNDYEDVVKNITHVAGTKLFGRVEKVSVFEESYKLGGCLVTSNVTITSICSDVLEIF